MKFLTSFLSLVFSLLLLVVFLVCFLELKIDALDLQSQLAALLFSAFSLWIAYSFLDRIYRRIHPTMYYSSWAANEQNSGFSLIQSLISSLRSAILNLAILIISWALLFLIIVPLHLITLEQEKDQNNLLWFTIFGFLGFIILGTLVQWGYRRGVLNFMMEKSGKSSNKTTNKKKAGHRAGKLQIRIKDEGKKINPSKRGIEKNKSATQLQRLLWLRNISAPIAALTGILAIVYYYQMAGKLSKEEVFSFLIIWGILFFVAWIGTTFILADRTPLRQLRLGIGLWIHAALVAICAPFLFIFELTGRSGRPEKQWTIVPKLGRWVSKLLRSSRLFWFPAILLATLILQIKILETKDDSFGTLICFLVGISAYEIIYRFFDYLISRRNNQENRLVFLRVFGDRRRGRFLFRHIVPRWKGLGSITCIAAPDVSIHQLEADIGFDIIFGRLRHRFLSRDEANVIGRHINSKALGSVWEDHCFDDSWMSAVHSMLTQNAIVLMDLRGFGPQRKGCIYELGVLRDNISIESVVFLIDETTDYKFLEKTLERLWKTISIDSPNEKQSQVTIFRLSKNKKSSARQLVKLLIEACVSTEAYHKSHGKVYLKKLIDDLQLLAADASVQIKAVGGGRSPGKKVLEAGYSSDHDLGSTNFLSSWGLITDQQYDAINAVNDAVQEIRIEYSKLSAAQIKDDPDWQELRVAARLCLKALGKRRSTPTSSTK